MARLPGHEPVELFRTKKAFNTTYVKTYERDMDPIWFIWVEHHQVDHHLLAPRNIKQTIANTGQAFHITNLGTPNEVYKNVLHNSGLGFAN